MHQKRSTRIFGISLGLLLVSGTVIIAAVWLYTERGQTQEKIPDVPMQEQFNPETAQSPEPPITEPQPEIEEPPLNQPASGTVQPYQYEIRVNEGCLDVYYYQTDQLYLHTGIPCEMLDVSDQKQLEQGKYFKDEQELYGYLESCTS